LRAQRSQKKKAAPAVTEATEAEANRPAAGGLDLAALFEDHPRQL
jgi:hypothetical protein